MTLEDLRAFVSAYRAGSLSAAARELRCTQGAVAQHVRRLERELGIELFTRLRRGVEPTSSGELLYEGASGALGNLQMALEGIERTRQGLKGRLAITASAMAASGFLRQSILDIQARRPETTVHVEPQNIAEGRLAALREGRVDLAFIPLTDSIRGLEVRRVFGMELRLLVHHAHTLAKRKRLRAAELGSIRYIAQSPSSATYRHLERALRRVGVLLEPSETIDDPIAAILWVELGRGETFIPAVQVPQAERSGLAKSLRVSSLPPIEMGWAARSFALLPPPANEFLESFQSFADRLS